MIRDDVYTPGELDLSDGTLRVVQAEPGGKLIEAIPEIEAVREIKSGGRYAVVIEEKLSDTSAQRVAEHLRVAGDRLGCKFILFPGPIKIYDLDAKDQQAKS